jgi:37-kD nucleoid-associated bacterial protein
MNIRTFEIETIGRLAVHTIIAKTPTRDARARTRDELLEFSSEENDTLKMRLVSALKNPAKTFQLEFEDKSVNIIYEMLSEDSGLSEAGFLEYSKSLAVRLAGAHFRTNIPGGHCLIGEGTTTTRIPFFFIVKAELHEVFNIEENALRVVKDVFLSPAKDLYKVAIFFKEKSDISAFMYDDQFSLQKKDLTEYFYRQFLGLTTEKNDRLRSKNFYEKTKAFAEKNVDNVKDRIGIIKALDVLYREDGSGVISAGTFSDTYFEGELKAKYDERVVKQFPTAFTKDISLVENRAGLQRVTIPLSYAVEISGNATSLDNVEVIEDPNSLALERIGIEINSGNVRKLIVVKEADVGDRVKQEVPF